MNTEEILTELFAELEEKAYDITWHKYYYKEANQVIRRHIEKIKNNVVVAPVSLAERREAAVCLHPKEAIHIDWDGDAFCTKCETYP
jgi:hypothetical protein